MKEKEKGHAKDYAWELFSKTGQISYYLLYKDLTKK